MRGSFGYGGQQRSYSFSCFHADLIPNATQAVFMPDLKCEWVCIKNRTSSSGNAIIGSERLSIVGTGITLEPGDITGWIPVQNLAFIWHKEDDATTFLEYMAIIRCQQSLETNYLLQEDGAFLLFEDDAFILLEFV